MYVSVHSLAKAKLYRYKIHKVHAQAHAHIITAYIFLIYFYKFIVPKLTEIH